MEEKKIGLVYRAKYRDYSFPKGHLEGVETFMECAIRETEEETGYSCNIISQSKVRIIEYIDSLGEHVCLYMFLAKQTGLTTKKIAPEDTEQLLWIDFENVENKLSYENLKQFWNSIKQEVYNILQVEK